VARKIDVEVRKIISSAHSRALEVMKTYREQLDGLAQNLIQKETLDEAEVNALLSETLVKATSL